MQIPADRPDAQPGVRLSPGTRLNGIFEIDQHLGAGGMGEIHRGHAIENGELVAIKVMRSDLADDETALALFRKEAKALHALHHEAIVRYFVFSNDPGIRRHYLAMEFVHGERLSHIVQRRRLDFDQVRQLQQRLAAALHEAHHGRPGFYARLHRSRTIRPPTDCRPEALPALTHVSGQQCPVRLRRPEGVR